MANIPIINPPNKEHLGFCWHHQFTIPLLFDDCLSLLQKVCALWAKLNDVIDALNEFNDEFNAWAKSVEESLKDLYAKYEALDTRVTNIENELQSIETELNNIKNDITNINQRIDNIETRVSNVENEITDIKQSISNIENSITQIQADMTALEARVKKLEDLLKNLNIIPPQTILDLTDNDSVWATVWGAWWDWFCTNVIDFASGDSKSNWELSNNLKWHDTVTKPKRTIQIGYLGQPVALVKLPFIAVRKSVWTSKPTIAQINAAAPNFKADALYPANGFFNLTLTQEFGYTMDEVKLMTSYIPFLTKDSTIVKIDNKWAYTSFAVQADVRLQIPKTGTDAKLAIVPQSITLAAVPNAEDVSIATAWDLYIYCIAENG
jgi:archaellum component FlaC|nr:MAG TPA: chromosome segregation ATPase [Caudoviricetes sp.]